MCKVCRNPECTKGAKCKDPIMQLNSKHMPSTPAQVESFLCENCQKLECSLCKQSKTKDALSKEQLNNSIRPGRRLKCIDCCHPPRAATRCRTCSVCRDAACSGKKKSCKGVVVALYPKQMPKSLDDVNSFLCSNCNFVTCVAKKADGRICGKVAPKKSHEALKGRRNAYTCGDCLTEEKTKKSLAAAMTPK